MSNSAAPVPGHLIAEARADDLVGVLAIYNEVIRNSTAVYQEQAYDSVRGGAWFAAKLASGYPVVVTRDASGITGFGSFGEFRAWPCYRATVEHSVHVRADCRGRGIGRQIVEHLMARAVSLDKHVMIAGIDADNAGSIRLHERLGFSVVGHFHEVGYKFGRWLDLKFLQRILPAKASV